MSQPAGDAAARAAVERELAALCRWAAGLRAADIPARVQSQAVLILGDNIAAALSAADEPELHAYHEQLIGNGGPAQATLLRAGAPKVALLDAAVGNGLASTWNELDDGYTRTAVHPGALSQPLILAAAEAGHLPMADTLRAVVGAYEIGTRFARAWPGTLPRLHPHGVYNTICAAAGLALLRGYDAAQLLRTLTAAATLVAPGPYSHPIEGALVRNAWPAAGAWLGAFACDMARLGVAGTPGGPYDVYTRGLGAPAVPSELTDGLGTDWTICDGYHKLYGACHHSHAAMEAIESILARRPDLRGGRQVRRVLMEGSPMAMNFDNAAPQTTLGAKFSIPHALAATLAHGADDPRNFLDPSLADADIIALRKRVAMAPLPAVKPWPLDRPARVTLELEDGSALTAECEAALGSPARPLDAARVLRKIRELSARDAPGLEAAVVTLREAIAQAASLPACSAWIADFFAPP
ncbi:MAG: MmgE/PrpD family protein [Burkholderiales bacterium]|nr:MmgE/PrpD family protein [Burkholderiales bacterium]